MKRKLNEDDVAILKAYADANMNATIASAKSNWGRSAFYRHLDKVHIHTGKDPRNFYQLHELINTFNNEERTKAYANSETHGDGFLQ
jgi:hypothetical protein